MPHSIAGLVLCLAATAGTHQKGPAMHAKGTFTVKVAPVGDADKAEGSTMGRMTIEKRLSGDLEGTGKGQMLTAMSDVKGSGAYVAIERITGTIHGRKGSFALQHAGTMQGKSMGLKITVVPDSGTGELAGIDGTFAIVIEGDKHTYDFEYTLAH